MWGVSLITTNFRAQKEVISEDTSTDVDRNEYRGGRRGVYAPRRAAITATVSSAHVERRESLHAGLKTLSCRVLCQGLGH